VTKILHKRGLSVTRAFYKTCLGFVNSHRTEAGECFGMQILTSFSINLLVVYHESVNLIGYLTRRLCADSQQL